MMEWKVEHFNSEQIKKIKFLLDIIQKKSKWDAQLDKEVNLESQRSWQYYDPKLPEWLQ